MNEKKTFQIAKTVENPIDTCYILQYDSQQLLRFYACKNYSKERAVYAWTGNTIY